MAHNFEKYNNSIADTLNTPYDYGSVMHYPNNAFSSNSLPTIEPIQPNVTIGQRVNLSAIDIQEVRILYNCSATGITLPLLTTTTATIIYSVNTTVSSVLTVNNPIYDRRGDGNSRCYYDTFDLSVSMAGTYYIRSHSTMDTYGYLYNSSFIPNHPNLNLIASDDDSSGGTQFGFALSLEPRVRYTLVPTTFSNMVTGPYTVIVSGPQRVTLIRTSIVETTPVAPITTDGYQTNPATMIYMINTTVSSELTVNNPIYDRRGDGNSSCYYDTFDLSVTIAGTYRIGSNSAMDTYGYLYNGSFIPNHPNLNLIASNDDSNGGTQFGFALSLQPNAKYTLVATTFSDMATGPYTVIVSGSQRVTLIRTSNVGTTPVAPITTGGYQTNPATMIYMINTTVSSELTVNNPIYDRRGDGNSSCYYDTFDLSVTIAGTYRIGSKSAMDTYGYLYNGSFISNHPNLNLIASDDDSSGGAQFGFALSLQPHAIYTLLVTTFSDFETGPYTVIASGLQRVTLTRTSIVGTTPEAPTTTDGYETYPTIILNIFNTTASSILTSDNPAYVRPGGSNASYYYDTFSLMVPMGGNYDIGTDGALDTFGSLYYGDFIPDHPELNIITYNDDGSEGPPFRLEVVLEAHVRYTLVITTFNQKATGPYTLIVSGLMLVSLTRTTDMAVTQVTRTTTDGYETHPTIILNIFNTTASSILTSDNPTYMRPGGSNASYYYDTFSLMVPMGGNYDIGTDGALDTFGSLYYGDFIPDHPELNIITYNDDGSEGPPFRLEVVLEAHVRYTLVITTFNQKATGPYTLIVSGLMLVSLTRTTDMAVTQMTRTTTDRYSTAETTNAYMINTTVYSALSLANPRYARPDTSNSTYYYDTFNVKTNITGLYTIASNSAIDTYGFLYNGSFFPNSPTRNLVISDDESGGNAQFRLSVYLQSYAQYVLVVTTYYGNVFGPYMVMTSGLGHVHILRTTATITTQITSTATSVINTKTTTGYVFNTIASSIWTAKNPTYARPHGSNSSRNYHYDTFNVTARIAGLYTIASNSTIDTYGYFYNGSFIQNSPLWNLAAFDDDSAGNGQFRLNVYLESNVAYTLVATTFSDNTTGRYTVIVQGPTRVSIILTTIESVTNTTTPTSSYTNMLTTNSPTFRRTKDSDLSYFQAIQVTVLTAGTYSFKSDSLLDAYGYLYENNFNPSNPRANLLAEDDDSGGNQQFLMDYPMQYGSGYILVFTTHNPRMTGTFSILTSDPSKVNLKYLHIIPVSSSPAITCIGFSMMVNVVVLLMSIIIMTISGQDRHIFL
ncbi:unnamed protein product [Rotaria magnacalcarata]|uniref:Metalloendopeptidase n=1 Tax=Rotaria magnacalcarata TaxID=392030 RepID=A0A815LKW6_9BILA|nr:unnamed protein product [Rotaria magnacalcarata]